ncbi:MFS family permease [Amorphus suaedae]
MSQQLGVSLATRNVTQVSGICAAHGLSHVYMLVLPLMFPYFRDAFDVTYLELGLAVTVFGCVTTVTQTPIGFLVDRTGPRRTLVSGLILGGLTFILLSQTFTYTWLLIAGGLIGLANSVYHPADYAILSHSVVDRWIGRAFSYHTFSGNLGTAVAPLLIISLVEGLGVRGALVAVGSIGLAVAAALLLATPSDSKSAYPHPSAGGDTVRALLTKPRIWLLTGFFLLIGLSLMGISNFGIVALQGAFGFTLASATVALTAYLGASAVGVLVGGLLADRVKAHGQVTAVCFGINAAIVAAIAFTALPANGVTLLMGIAGLFSGMIAPSRDMIVRKSASAGAMGRVFGLVTTGFSIGGIFGPIIYGTVMDMQLPSMVFVIVAVAMVAALTLSLAVDRTSASGANALSETKPAAVGPLKRQ